MTLHTDSDHIHLVTDPTLFVIGPEGRPQGIVPYRLGVPSMNMRRDAQGVIRPFQPSSADDGTPEWQPSRSSTAQENAIPYLLLLLK